MSVVIVQVVLVSTCNIATTTRGILASVFIVLVVQVITTNQ